ncbi:class I SAM-dependent methyltransferase [Rhizobium tubonense]|uniref:Phospholipid methyltransferase n=1 Tax=Rhizobium tubonense TaxID=484088 RepID=A0A2W4EL22_9HYPH|nr:methyltransferase domain-containing protein [Rhizobium tubonense]PZM12113.1 phospholipid methyltransferase [Rhizobium tubonense]
MTANTTCSDFVQFFRSWVSNPRQVSAIAPSGERLARLMTREIEALDEPVLELGPGTGVFTRALLARGVRECDLTLIEFGAEFVGALSGRFPKARVVQMDAGEIAEAGLFDGNPVGAVVSGLPLLSMPPSKVAAILSGAFSVLRAGGAFYQFTYGPRCPVQRAIMEGLDLQATRIGGTVRNLPPASVYRISRKAPTEISSARRRYGGKSIDADISLVAAEMTAERNVSNLGSLNPGL